MITTRANPYDDGFWAGYWGKAYHNPHSKGSKAFIDYDTGYMHGENAAVLTV